MNLPPPCPRALLPLAFHQERIARLCAIALRHGLMALALGMAPALLIAPGQATAQDTASTADYDIPAAPLGVALSQFAAAAGVTLSFDPAQTQGKQSPGLKGRHSIGTGFFELLAGSGLQAMDRGAGNYILQTAPAFKGAASVLPAVKVTAERDTETAQGPVKGYVAKRSATGSKTDTPLIETPQTINVVTADEIAARGGGRSLTDVLAYTPGFFNPETVDTRNDNGGTLRGFTVSNSLYLDGLRLPNGLDRAVPQVEPYGLERVEVLKGPASVLYGQNAPGGVINMVSKRPKAEAENQVLFAVATFNQLEGSADFSGPIAANQAFLYRLTGFVRDSETQVDFVDDNRLYLAPSFTWVAGPDTRLTLLSHYQKDEGGEFSNQLPAAGTRDPSPNGKIPVSRYTGEPDFDRYDRRQYALGYAAEHRFSDAWSVSQDFRYLNLNVDYRNLILPALREDGRTVDRTLYFFDETLKSYSLDTRSQAVFKTASIEHRLLTGVDYRRYSTDNANGYYFDEGGSLDVFAPVYGQPLNDLPANAISDFEGKQVGLYVQDQLTIGRWVVTLGGRYDQADSALRFSGEVYEEHDDDAFTGRAGLVYLFDNGFAPYLSYSEAFEPPFRSTVDFFGKPFKPVTGDQYEAGLKYQPASSNSFITLSVFELTQQNVLTEDLEHQDEGFFQKQIGEVRVRGMELEGKASLARLDLTASYAYLDSEYTRSDDGNQGLQVAGVPKHQVSFWAIYRLSGGLDGLDVGGGVRHNGAFFGDGFQEWNNDAVTLIDLAVGYDLGRLIGQPADSLRLSLNARNLADKEYVNCSGSDFCSYGATRTVQGTVSYRW